jgi:hypothetical protein
VLSPSHSWVNREYVCEVNIIIWWALCRRQYMN